MAKDDPQELAKSIASLLRQRFEPGDIGYRTAMLIADAFADALDPPPEREQEIPPGELVADDEPYIFVQSEGGLRFLAGGPSACSPDEVHLASSAEVQSFAKEYPTTLHEALLHLARLLVSQEQPPELIGGDEDVFTTPERRLGKSGEYCFDVADGRVFQIDYDTVIAAWIVKPKDNHYEQQGTDA